LFFKVFILYKYIKIIFSFFKFYKKYNYTAEAKCLKGLHTPSKTWPTLLLALVGLKRNQLKVHRFGREPLKEKVFVVFSLWEEKTKCSIFIKILNI
jgi:hypothetical protein